MFESRESMLAYALDIAEANAQAAADYSKHYSNKTEAIKAYRVNTIDTLIENGVRYGTVINSAINQYDRAIKEIKFPRRRK